MRAFITLRSVAGLHTSTVGPPPLRQVRVEVCVRATTSYLVIARVAHLRVNLEERSSISDTIMLWSHSNIYLKVIKWWWDDQG